MKRLICLIALFAMLQASIATAGDPSNILQSFERAPQYTVYVQKSIGAGKRKTPLEFGLSFERRTQIATDAALSAVPSSVRVIDLRIASQGGGIRLNGMKLTGSQGAMSYSGDSYNDEGYWSLGSPWFVIGVIAGIFGGLCL